MVFCLTRCLRLSLFLLDGRRLSLQSCERGRGLRLLLLHGLLHLGHGRLLLGLAPRHRGHTLLHLGAGSRQRLLGCLKLLILRRSLHPSTPSP